MLVGYFYATVDQVDRPDGIIGRYGENNKYTNGVEMLKFSKNNEMKTLNDRAPTPEEALWTRTKNAKARESAPLWTT